MKSSHRGFQFALQSPLMKAGWELEAGRREVILKRATLQECRRQLDTLLQERNQLLLRCNAIAGVTLDLVLRDLQIQYLVEIERRVVEARRHHEERFQDWTVAVDRCAYKQRHFDGLTEIRTQQHKAFALEHTRQDARRSDDAWLMRHGTDTTDGDIL